MIVFDLQKQQEASSDEDDAVEPESTLYVKNINFDTTEDSLREVMHLYLLLNACHPAGMSSGFNIA